MEESTSVIKIVPGTKTKVLSVMIPVVIVAGILKAVMDHFNPANAQEQNIQTTVALLVAYCFFSLRGLNRYRVFMELTPDKLTWRQGFKPLGKNLSLNYSQIDSVAITSLTSTLIVVLKPEKGLPKELKLAPSFQIAEGKIAQPVGEKIEKEIASNNPATREIYYLKCEIEKRILQTAI
jgi:hypothetical protein